MRLVRSLICLRKNSRKNYYKGHTMRLLINFGDNDFYVTFTETLELFKNYTVAANIDYGDITKKMVVDFFNENTERVYWVLQNKYEYDLDWDASSYLRIFTDDVFLGDSVSDKIDNEFLNGEMFLLDFETGEISSI